MGRIIKNVLSGFLFGVVVIVICIGIGAGITNSYAKSVNNTKDNYGGNYFAVIEQWNDTNTKYRIIYDKSTGVKYFAVESARDYSITPLYNADGSLQLYDPKR